MKRRSSVVAIACVLVAALFLVVTAGSALAEKTSSLTGTMEKSGTDYRIKVGIRTYILKGTNLDAGNNRKVKVEGKHFTDDQGRPAFDVEKYEVIPQK